MTVFDRVLGALGFKPESVVTLDRLTRFAPYGDPAILQALVDGADALAAAGLTGKRLALFLANVSVETGGLRCLEENLNYTAKRLTEVWPKRFPSLALAQGCANDPEKLANRVYGNRLGNCEPDDGWRYRGSGMLQTTGRENFREAGHETDPEALRTPAGALAAALVFWTNRNLNALADADAVTAVRKIINGGTNGLAEVKEAYADALAIFTKEEPHA